MKNLVYKKINNTQEVDFEEAKSLLKKNKIEKLPIINDNYEIIGLITVKRYRKEIIIS
ncbi:MAG: hypothetical protein KatS3mg068_0276 [Candidatus Sericytochromatia bacterium]|nr:MAG: hypothetical protein KatS3mg068_0276 [Candidatus Sericytochromatia bacterium]